MGRMIKRYGGKVGNEFFNADQHQGTIHKEKIKYIFILLIGVAGAIGGTLMLKNSDPISENRSCRDTRGTFITNVLDANETMGFVQNQVGHSSIKPIVNHYYNRIPRDQDGQKLEEALKNAQVLPDLEDE